jgi:hypothetical protein
MRKKTLDRDQERKGKKNLYYKKYKFLVPQDFRKKYKKLKTYFIRRFEAIIFRMSKSKSSLYCPFCKNLNLEFTTHNLRTSGGRVICPVLLETKCTNCGVKGHTKKKCCQKEQVQELKPHVSIPLPITTTNRFAIYSDTESETEEELEDGEIREELEEGEIREKWVPHAYQSQYPSCPYQETKEPDEEETTTTTPMRRPKLLETRTTRCWQKVVNWCDWEASDDEDEDD